MFSHSSLPFTICSPTYPILFHLPLFSPEVLTLISSSSPIQHTQSILHLRHPHSSSTLFSISPSTHISYFRLPLLSPEVLILVFSFSPIQYTQSILHLRHPHSSSTLFSISPYAHPYLLFDLVCPVTFAPLFSPGILILVPSSSSSLSDVIIPRHSAMSETVNSIIFQALNTDTVPQSIKDEVREQLKYVSLEKKISLAVQLKNTSYKIKTVLETFLPENKPHTPSLRSGSVR